MAGADTVNQTHPVSPASASQSERDRKEPWDVANLIEVSPLGDLLLRAARRWPDNEFVVFPEKRSTYRQFAHRALEYARSLMALGVQHGDHVALFLPSCAEFIEVFFGVTLAGAVPVPVNARYRGVELRYLIDNSDAVAIVTCGHVTQGVNMFERLDEALGNLGENADPANLSLPAFPKLKSISMISGAAKGALSPQQLDALANKVTLDQVMERRAGVRLRDPGLVLYTSGTTSNPKGCLLSHEAIVRVGGALAARIELTVEDRFWSPLPTFHIAAIQLMMAVLHVGASYLSMQHFDAGDSLKMMEEEKATINYVTFATFLVDMLNHPDFDKTDLSHLRLMNSNLPVQPKELQPEVARRFPNVFQTSTYGLSEASGAVTTSKLTDSYEIRMARLGGPLPGVRVKIVDPKGNEVPTGSWGEIAVKSFGIIDGYYKDPEKTAQALKDGWLHTGDIGSLDENGHLMFHGRTKEMLKVGGENVAAIEVETFIGDHPAVKLCQVAGLPDQRLVEVPVAFIELKPGASTTEQEIIAFCKGKISSFKVPRHVRFVTEWPIGASKIQKFKLVDSLMAELGMSKE
jgi:acyl-CoA synthetase (AMP-forming)/AMP-acid ligase II